MKILSGIQPSGELHIGNYFGMIKRMVENQERGELYAFIVNYHAMTSVTDGKTLKENTINAAVNMLSLGIDPQKAIFWAQSDLPEVLELYWILSNFTPMGLLERAHSYKDKTARGIAANHGLFSYPVLMAADILLFNADLVPVGKDQIQHVEITRDIAQKFNNEYGEIFKLPEVSIDDGVATVPGIDGQKMSKSYKNTIEMFSEEKALKKRVSSIVTDSTPVEEPKDAQKCNIFALLTLFCNENELEEYKARYAKGGEGYGVFKAELKDKIWTYFEPYREKREYYLNHKDDVRDILKSGAIKAREKSAPILEKVRTVTGIL